MKQYGKNTEQANNNGNKGKWGFIISLLVFLFIISFFASIFLSFSGETKKHGNVARIPIKGIITTEGSYSDTVSKDTIELIKEANENPEIKAILFEINSPGGSPVATYEIADAIEKCNKTTVSLIREVGASGAYWIASSTDHIIANPMSITGSIGVIGSYLEFSGLMAKYNVTYERLVSGKYKDSGSPFKKLNDDERAKMQNELDVIHDYFIEAVSANRNLNYDYVKNFSTGEIFIGSEALKLGLIDELGSFDETEGYLEEKLNITKIEYANYERKMTFIDMLSGLTNNFGFNVGKGIGSSVKEQDFTIRT
jgi:protease IV